MSQEFFQRPLHLIILLLISIPCSAANRPPKKPINAKAAIEKIYSDRAKKVNEQNLKIKAEDALTPEEEREYKSKKFPLTMTPEQSRQDDEEASKDPDDQEERDLDELDDDAPGPVAGAGKSPSATDGKGKSGFYTPSSVPSSGGGTAVPGQADPNLIQFPGKKPSKP